MRISSVWGVWEGDGVKVVGAIFMLPTENYQIYGYCSLAGVLSFKFHSSPHFIHCRFTACVPTLKCCQSYDKTKGISQAPILQI